MLFKLKSLVSEGYLLTQYNKQISLDPYFFAILKVSSISFKLAIPVDMIIGFFVLAIFFINGISVISKDATL